MNRQRKHHGSSRNGSSRNASAEEGAVQAATAPSGPASAPRPHRMDIERPARDEPGSIEALPDAEPAPPGAASFIEPAGDPEQEATPPCLDES
jgi:hypothetical protein